MPEKRKKDIDRSIDRVTAGQIRANSSSTKTAHDSWDTKSSGNVENERAKSERPKVARAGDGRARHTFRVDF